MKSKIILISWIFFLAFGATLFAQKVEFIEPRFLLKSAAPDVSSFSLNGNHYILYSTLNMSAPLRLDLQLDSYTPDGKPLNSFMIDQKMNPVEPNFFEGLFVVGNQLMLFKMGYDNKAKTTSLFAYTLNEKGEKSEAIKLATIKAAGMINSGSFDITTSPDGQKVLVLSNLPYNKEFNEKLVLSIFDKDLNSIASKEIELPYLSSKQLSNVPFINNTGDVFLLKKIFAKKGTNDQELLFTFSTTLDLVKETAHVIGTNGIISSSQTCFDKTGNLVIGGLYFDFKKAGLNVEDPDGFFITVCTPKGELNSVFQTQSFMASVKTTQLIAAKNGGYFLVAQSENLKEENIPGSTSFQTNKNYDNQNAFIFRFDNNQLFMWKHELKRDSQRSVNDGAKANRVWCSLYGEDQFALVYKDAWYRNDGLEHNVVVPPLSTWTGDVINIIDNQGNMVKKYLIRDERIGGAKGQYYLIPTTGRIDSHSNFFFVGFRTQELVSIKVIL